MLLYYQNARGLNSKIETFYLASHCAHFHIIAITETWLNSSVSSSELFNDQYTVLRKDRNFEATSLTRGGGVLLAFRNYISVQNIDVSDVSNNFPMIDMLSCRCKVNNVVFYIILVYIPPSLNTTTFKQFFEVLEHVELFWNKNVIFLGDFNVRNFKNREQGDFRIEPIYAFLNCFHFRQYNNVLNTDNKLLDLVIANIKCEITRDTTPFVPEDQYHPALSITADISFQKKNTFTPNTNNISFNFRKADFPGLYDAILSIDWTFLEDINNVNDVVDLFYLKLYEKFETFVPKRKIFKHIYPTWYTHEIIKNVKLKAKFLRKYKATSNPEDQKEFKRLRILVKQQIGIAYNNFLIRAQTELPQNTAQFWSFVRAKNQTSRIPSTMHYENQEYDNQEVIVNVFAKYFSSIFCQTSGNPLGAALSSSNIVTNNHISVDSVSEFEILQAAKKLKNKFTSGSDDIPSFLVKDCIGALVIPLRIIFNLSLGTADFPLRWKEAKVCPIFKSGDKQNITNYRAVSILSNFAKLLEIVIYARIYPDVRNAISPYQHGFVDRRSSVTNLSILTQFISEVVDEQGQVDVIYMDFAKAFDRIDHATLLSKMNTFGFSNSLIEFFTSYLSGRYQYISYNGYQSYRYLVTSGVPQGSNLGPLLFLLSINDISLSIHCQQLLFADDLKIYSRINNINDCRLLQADIERVENWCRTNKLALNPTKCKVMTYTHKRTPILSTYNINDINIDRSTTITDLGVIFDVALSFRLQLEHITNQAYKMYGFILRNCKSFTNINALKLLYFSYVRSKLEYCSIVWNPYYRYQAQSIENIQRKFLKYLSYKIDAVYPEQGIPYGHLLERHEVISLNMRRKTALLIFIHKIFNAKTDCGDLLAQFNIHIPRQTARYDNMFKCKTARTNLYLKSPMFTMCNIFNCISRHCDINYCSQSQIVEIGLTHLNDEFVKE